MISKSRKVRKPWANWVVTSESQTDTIWPATTRHSVLADIEPSGEIDARVLRSIHHQDPMPPRGRKSTTAVAVYVAETPPLEACASEGAPGDEYNYKEVEPAVPALALTSTPHDIAERAAAAVRLDKMRKARDAALEDRDSARSCRSSSRSSKRSSRSPVTRRRRRARLEAKRSWRKVAC